MHFSAFIRDGNTWQKFVSALLISESTKTDSIAEGFKDISSDRFGDLGIDGIGSASQTIYQMYFPFTKPKEPQHRRINRKLSDTCRKLAKNKKEVAGILGNKVQKLILVVPEGPDRHIRRKETDLQGKYPFAIEVWGQQHVEILLNRNFDAGKSFLPRIFNDKIQLNPQEKAETLNSYLSMIAEKYSRADYRGIADVEKHQKIVSLPLDLVYVKRSLSRERHSLTEEIGEWTEENILRNHKTVVILAGPGAGKSTLIKQYARHHAKNVLCGSHGLVPIVLPIAQITQTIDQGPMKALEKVLKYHVIDSWGEIVWDVLDEQIQDGHALLLLDGLDEIADENMRSVLIRMIESFLLHRQGENRVIITSRPNGYLRLSGSVEHFNLLPFDSRQVRDFVRRWMKAFHGMSDSIADDTQLLSQIESLRLIELASNPLILVILCYVFRDRGELPKSRVEVFDLSLRTLVDSWNKWRPLEERVSNVTAQAPTRILRVWSRIAEWLQRQKVGGAVHKNRLLAELEKVIATTHSTADAQIEALEFLRIALERAGLLVETSADHFSFWHGAFREYLAAVELCTPSYQTSAKLLSVREDPWWRDTIVQTIAYIATIQRDQETASKTLLATLYEAPPAMELVVHYLLRLAAECISCGVPLSEDVVVDLFSELVMVACTHPYKSQIDAVVI